MRLDDKVDNVAFVAQSATRLARTLFDQAVDDALPDELRPDVVRAFVIMALGEAYARLTAEELKSLKPAEFARIVEERAAALSAGIYKLAGRCQ